MKGTILQKISQYLMEITTTRLLSLLPGAWRTRLAVPPTQPPPEPIDLSLSGIGMSVMAVHRRLLLL